MTTRTLDMANVIASDVTIAGDKTFSGDIIASSPLSHRNLIINGAMQVSQRGTSFTGFGAAVNYSLDRFFTYHSSDGAFTISQESSVVPTGFKNSLKILITTADASIAAGQRLIVGTRCEGNVVSHLNWGTSNAETVTLSFYVRSSITGTHGGAIGNGSDNRNYPFTYTISSADTWERKSITIAGDQTGTWATDNGRSLQVIWGLGVGSTYSGPAGAWAAGDKNSANGATTNVLGTLNATWYLTGVQLELGDNATPFEHRSFGEELQKCQRYYQKSHDYSSNPSTSTDADDAICGNSWADGNCNFEQGFVGGPMRTSPTVVLRPRGSTTTGQVNAAGSNSSASASQISSNTVGYIAITSGSNNNYVCFSYECKAEL